MLSLNIHINNKTYKKGMIALFVVVAGGFACLRSGMSIQDVQGWLVKEPVAPTAWEVLDEAMIASGTTIKADTNTIIHLPLNFTKISRETLFGQKGKSVRYWGYCFPENYDPTTVDSRRGFPGLIFLSEKERAVRRAAELEQKRRLSPNYIPRTEADLNDYLNRPMKSIRHQVDSFKPGMLCYIMSAKALAIGLDGDNDLLNDRLERDLKTDTTKSDTDGDGINDGTEYKYGTIPTIRDSDGDGIIDGLEDANWNGKLDIGESNPTLMDSDRDGLCDGYCRVQLSNGQYIFMGEDENLNGVLDDGETSPYKYDTDGDEYSDHVEYLTCIAEEKEDCPDGLPN